MHNKTLLMLLSIIMISACSISPPNLSSALLSDDHSFMGAINFAPKTIDYKNRSGDTASYVQSIIDLSGIIELKPFYVSPIVNVGNFGLGFGYKYGNRLIIGGFSSHPFESSGFDYGVNEYLRTYGNVVVWHEIYTAQLHRYFPFNDTKNIFIGERRIINSGSFEKRVGSLVFT